MTKRSKSSKMYPKIDPFNTGKLKVSDLHTLYYEESGNRAGMPVVYLHGGPGGSSSEEDRRYFDPSVYRIILFDQRGAGKSAPACSLMENDTWSLISDMEKLRQHLQIERWVLFGGSWGSTLALIYAQTHVQRVLALILRGILLFQDYELKWTFQQGASNLFPDRWEKFLAPIPEAERDELISAYHRRLTGDNEDEKLYCANTMTAWQAAILRLRVDEKFLDKVANTAFTLTHSQIQCHYFKNKGFLSPNQILDQMHIIQKAKIPVTIINGRYDVVCPLKSAWDLHKKLPQADFHIVEGAGHSAKEKNITKLLVQACDKYKFLQF